MADIDVNKLIQDNLAAFYRYAYERLYNKDKATDLAHEIVVEILASAKNLRDDKAFWAFAWKIAENTFRKFIRREDIKRRCELDLEKASYETICSPEHEYIFNEDEKDSTYLLRRELSLLAKAHRDILVAYYVDNKSCSQISKEQKISVEMVKYHLFKIRKILKEGIGMTRELGEKSYNPGVFRINFWGDFNRYNHLCDRLLPGNILLSAYKKPMSAEELSLELGVAMPYLEDEIAILVAAGVLKEVGKKYQTNLVILTDEYEKSFEKETAPIYEEVSAEIYNIVHETLPQVRELDFRGNDYDDNRLMFALLNIAFVNGFWRAEYLSPYGKNPWLPLECHGWIWGYDNNFKNSHFKGITMHTPNSSNTAWFSSENYKVILPCQLYDHSYFSLKIEAVCDAILENDADRNNQTLPWLIENRFIFSENGRLSANFPVFTNDVYEQILDALEPAIAKTASCMIDISDRAAKILEKTAPAAVKDQCETIAKINHRLDAAAFILEKLIADGKLYLPKEKTPLCMWGVKK